MEPQLVINCGIIDNTPPAYSPFSRSQADIYMGKYYKQGVTASAACLMKDDDDLEGDDDDDEGSFRTCCSVWEMKMNQKAVKHLHANMLHFGTEVTVEALKEGKIINFVNVYGLAINYSITRIIHRRKVLQITFFAIVRKKTFTVQAISYIKILA